MPKIRARFPTAISVSLNLRAFTTAQDEPDHDLQAAHPHGKGEVAQEGAAQLVDVLRETLHPQCAQSHLVTQPAEKLAEDEAEHDGEERAGGEHGREPAHRAPLRSLAPAVDSEEDAGHEAEDRPVPHVAQHHPEDGGEEGGDELRRVDRAVLRQGQEAQQRLEGAHGLHVGQQHRGSFPIPRGLTRRTSTAGPALSATAAASFSLSASATQPRRRKV